MVTVLARGRLCFLVVRLYDQEPLCQIVCALIGDDEARIQPDGIAQVSVGPAVLRDTVFLLIAVIVDIGSFVSK